MPTLNLDLRGRLPKIAKLAMEHAPYETGEGDSDLDLTAYRALIWPQRAAIAAALRSIVEKKSPRRNKKTIRLASDSFVRRYIVGEEDLGCDIAVCVLCDYHGTLDGEVGALLPGDMFVFAVRGEPSAYLPLEILR